jgi:chemotaxis protein methyltransferase CheR
MVLSEYARDHGGVDFGILGTDVSTRVLAAAVRGIYDFARIEDVPMAFRPRYFLRDRSGSRVRIIPELRRKLTFHRLNLMEPEYHVRTLFDIIFFRNVMIYFDRETQESVINKLCRNLKTDGLLFVGHSESITGLRIPLTQVAPAVFQKQA